MNSASHEVCVAYVSTAEVWVDSAVDWTLSGLNKVGFTVIICSHLFQFAAKVHKPMLKACQRHDYRITASSVIKFTANNSRFACGLGRRSA